MTAREIATFVGKSQRSIEMRAKKENWPFFEEKGNGRGGKVKKYTLFSLPVDIRQKIDMRELIIERSVNWVERLLCSPRAERYSYYFLFFAIGFFGKVIIDIINR